MKSVCSLLFLLFASLTFSQKVTVHGYVTDQFSGERLMGASIIVYPDNIGTTSNNYGFYSITIPHVKDSIEIIFSFVAYQTQIHKVLWKKDERLDIQLQPYTASLNGVTVVSKKNDLVNKTQMSTISLSPGQIKKIPAMFGEADALKAIQLLPGVQAGYEGNGGFYVRGGGADENLILLDGVPVYNAMHLFGFLSVFNSDALQTIDVIKGGFPARYGGRLSSVLDIRMKEGNNNELHGEGGVSLLAGRVTLEGPIKKKKSSFMISGRRTYTDLYMRPLIKSLNSNGAEANYYFYDLNAKLNFYLSEKDHLFISGYFGKDKFTGNEGYDFNEDTVQVNGDRYLVSMQWGNNTAMLRWNHQFNKKLFANITTNYTQYKLDLLNRQSITQSFSSNGNYVQLYSSGINDKAVKFDMDYLPGANHFIKTGASVTWHHFSPGAFQTKITNTLYQSDSSYHAGSVNATEYDAYAEDDIRLSSKLKINIGVHWSAFHVRNKTFTSLQPRLSARYLLNNKMSLKASYAQMTQYLHLLTNSGVGMPTDLWVPATNTVPSENSMQLAVGWNYNWKNNIEFSTEAYYKKMHHVIEYAEGSTFINALTNWENKMVTGTGTAYGIEWMAQKQKGKTTGLIGYTLSWSNRLFADLNGGKEFPYKYDRRHDIKIALSQELSKNISLSMDWVYGTGMATTMPVAVYLNNNNSEVEVYGSRNSYRIPAYHRLDLSAKFTKQKKKYERSWVISIYNVYNRLNTYFIYRKSEYNSTTNTYQNKFYKFALFPIIPSISYEFKF